MEPTIWGPAAWKFLHTITFQYPENPTDNDKRKYYIFFNTLKDVLPCPNCKEHYSKNIEKLPIQLESRDDFIKWLIDIHNEVNIINKKKKYSYEEVYKLYNNMYDNGSNGSNDYKEIGSIIIIILVIIIGYYYYINYYEKNN